MGRPVKKKDGRKRENTPGRRGKAYPQAYKDRAKELFVQGVNPYQVHKSLEISERTAYDWFEKWKLGGGVVTGQPMPLAAQEVEKSLPPPNIAPKRLQDLDPEVAERVNDFAAFRLYYFKRKTPQFQRDAADQMTLAKRPILFLWPPGYGKSTMDSHDYPIWRMIRARVREERFSCLMLSKSENLSQAFLRRIKRTLEMNKALINDFGRFKPEYPILWKQTQLLVEGFGDDGEDVEKEPTFIAAGAGSQVYGWRVNLIICDDLVDSENSKNTDQTDKLFQWFSEELWSRLEPGDQLCVLGTRWSMFDLYGRLLALKDDESDEPLFDPVLFPAHDATKCVAGETCRCMTPCAHHPSYPDGCLLWPERWPYGEIRRVIIRLGQVRFDFQYNQMETPTEGTLCLPEWLDKCKDPDRALWDIPRGAKVICTIDPSPTQWAVCQTWAWLPGNENRGEGPFLYFVAQQRARMTAPQYIALIKDWTQKIRKKGFDPLWIIEENAAQRFLSQSTDFQMMRYELGGLSYKPHQTTRNKLDPEYGVQTLGPLYEFAKVSLPWADGASRENLKPLMDELKGYPFAPTDDCVMAHWFAVHHLKRQREPLTDPFIDPPGLPPYLKERRGAIDLRTGIRENLPGYMTGQRSA